MAKNQDYAEQLGHAWRLHREGQHNDAIREFSALLQTSSNNLDALYGLGLAERSAGQVEAAQEAFETCAAKIADAIQEHPHEDRFQMLQRMAKQRLDETKAK